MSGGEARGDHHDTGGDLEGDLWQEGLLGPEIKGGRGFRAQKAGILGIAESLCCTTKQAMDTCTHSLRPDHGGLFFLNMFLLI